MDQLPQPKTYPEVREESARKRPAILVDFDGTLSLRRERNPYDWSRVGEDEPNLPILAIVKSLSVFHTILVVSGRDEICRWQSEMWLHAHEVRFHELFMRPARDNRPDDVIKRELYEREIKEQYHVLAVIDDRSRVVKMWRELGLTTLQVAEGDF